MKKLLFSLLLAVFLMTACAGVAGAAELSSSMTLINKSNSLSTDYVPDDLVYLHNYMYAGSSVMMSKEAAEAMGRMIAAARADGITDMYGNSGYRSYSTQTYLHNRKINYYKSLGYGYDSAYYYASTVVAPPGTSEHQSGLALDITTSEDDNSMTDSFAYTRAGRWLAENCWKYGYILRYPADKVDITGYIYEPWHFRYVGTPHAEYMTKHNLCLEEYVALLQQQMLLEYTTASGHDYAIYYTELPDAPSLPGVVVGCSPATLSYGGYITTARPLYYDLQGHWSQSEVSDLIECGIITGYPNGTFGPERNVTRAELMTMLSRMCQLIITSDPQPDSRALLKQLKKDMKKAGELQMLYGDISPDDYYYAHLQNCSAVGLVPDVMNRVDGEQVFFDPSREAFRSEVALSLQPLLSVVPVRGASVAMPADMVQEDPALQQAVQLVLDHGIFKGDPYGNFNPHDPISRAEIGAVMNRVLELVAPDVVEKALAKDDQNE